LPGIDDGARDLADSVEMARQAERDGVLAVCATPHIRDDHDVLIDELSGRIAALNRELARCGVRTEILPGGEVAEPMLDSLEDDELRKVSLGGGGRWVLLEPGPGRLDDRVSYAVRRLADRGFGAVLAHPERHLADDSPARLAEIVDRGTLVQVTADFLVDPVTRPALLDLAGRGLVHLLGSDSHSSRAGRPVALRAGLQALTAVDRLVPHLRWIAEHGPRAVVRGEAAAPPF
jgi:protein-tyrosine phosphatase